MNMIVMQSKYLQQMVKNLVIFQRRISIFTRLMDAGKILHARVYSCYGADYAQWRVSIKICMIDFK